MKPNSQRPICAKAYNQAQRNLFFLSRRCIFLMSLPRTLGELRRSEFSEERLANRRVKDELRDNLLKRLRNQKSGPIFPGIVGYDDTVIPQIVNAILSRHNFILLGLRG